MNKQIIIDGCDVSKCKYFSKYQKIVRNNKCIVDIQNACVEEIKTKPCSQKHNCYFKDWQRKEQECEQQKAELELFKISNQTTTDQLKAENEKLKAELQNHKDNEQREIELKKQCADSFKEMQRMLYGKFDGKSLIEKRSPYGN